MKHAQVDYGVIHKAAEAERRYTLGVVYMPDEVDTQGEFAKAEDIEAAAWAFMERLQGLAQVGATVVKAALEAGDAGLTLDVTDVAETLAKGAGLDDMHLQVGDAGDLGTIVESYLAPADFEVGGQPVTKGTWLLGIRWSEQMFAKVKAGARTGLSMYGRAARQEAA